MFLAIIACGKPVVTIRSVVSYHITTAYNHNYLRCFSYYHITTVYNHNYLRYSYHITTVYNHNHLQ